MADNPRILNFYHLLNYRFNIPERLQMGKEASGRFDE